MTNPGKKKQDTHSKFNSLQPKKIDGKGRHLSYRVSVTFLEGMSEAKLMLLLMLMLMTTTRMRMMMRMRLRMMMMMMMMMMTTRKMIMVVNKKQP